MIINLILDCSPTIFSTIIVSCVIFRRFDGPLPAGWTKTRCWRSKCTITAKSSPTGKVNYCSQLVPAPHLPHQTAFQSKLGPIQTVTCSSDEGQYACTP